MNLLIVVVPLVACLVLAGAFLRARRTIRSLRAQLDHAAEAHVSKDSLLTQRYDLDALKDEFVSTVSHELRTPLTSIRAALGLLSAGLMGSVDAKAQNLVRIALTNTDRLIRLINDILDLERMQSGRAPLRVRRCSMRDLAQHSIETMAHMAEAVHVKLDLVLAAPPDALYFDGDPDRLMQVLTNLLSNAIKFSPPQSHVEVRIEAGPDNVRLRVSDNGRGIPADKLESIFGRFEQVETSDSQGKGGTGLGLAICRTIVQQHHGVISAEPNPTPGAVGASFLVTLPRLSRSQDHAAHPAAHPAGVEPSSSATGRTRQSSSTMA